MLFTLKPGECIRYNKQYYNEGETINVDPKHLTKRLEARLLPVEVEKIIEEIEIVEVLPIEPVEVVEEIKQEEPVKIEPEQVEPIKEIPAIIPKKKKRPYKRRNKK